MILVTGAGGKTGRAVVANLVAQNIPVRAWLRQPFIGFDGAEVFVGDLENQADWATAMRGIEKVYFICPNMHPNETLIGKLALTAARQAKVKHFVYHSVLHPQTHEMPHHWNKLRVEEMVFVSGLPFTILQPAVYMQNLLPQWATIKQRGLLQMPYPAHTKVSLVDLGDVAQAAATVLESDKFIGATLELAGTRALSQSQIAEQLTAELNRPVFFEETKLIDWVEANADLPVYKRDALLAMFGYYANYGLVGNPAVLSMILGKAPSGLADFVQAQ